MRFDVQSEKPVLYLAFLPIAVDILLVIFFVVVAFNNVRADIVTGLESIISDYLPVLTLLLFLLTLFIAWFLFEHQAVYNVRASMAFLAIGILFACAAILVWSSNAASSALL